MNTTYIEIAPSAQRDIKKFPRQLQRKLVEALELLERSPRPPGVEKIQGRPNFYRLSVGKNHRIIYHVRNNSLVIVLVARDRKDVYKNLGSLDAKLAAALSEMEKTDIGRQALLRVVK